MNRLLQSVSLAVLALFVAAGISATAERDRPTSAGKYELIRGTVEDVSGNQVTVRSPDGKEWKLMVDEGSTLRLDGRTAKLADFKKGTRVRVRYEPKDGRDRVVLMRTPLTARILAAEARDFLASLKDYGFDKKAEYERKLQPQLTDLDERIEDFQERAQEAGGDAKRKAEADLKELHRQRDALRDKVERLKSVGADGWSALKADIDRTMSDVYQTYDRAREKVK
jgi:hypothetical protein